MAFRAGPCLDTETVSEPAAENLTLRNDLFLLTQTPPRSGTKLAAQFT